MTPASRMERRRNDWMSAASAPRVGGPGFASATASSRPISGFARTRIAGAAGSRHALPARLNRQLRGATLIMHERKRALITGITGQDGSYLAELLLAKGYDVFGLVRRSSKANTNRIEHLLGDSSQSGGSLQLLSGDLLESASLIKALHVARPHEVYNLGAQSHVQVSFGRTRLHRQCDGAGSPARVGGDPPNWHWRQILPSLLVGAVRQSPGDPPAGRRPPSIPEALTRRPRLTPFT